MLQDAQRMLLDLYLECSNTGKTELADQIFTSTSEQHTPDHVARGTQEIVSYIIQTRAAFPDIKFVDEGRLADGDWVVFRWSVSGTHKGEFNGIGPTGRHVKLHGVTLARIDNGRIAHQVAYYDRLALLEQLGVVPAKREALSAAS